MSADTAPIMATSAAAVTFAVSTDQVHQVVPKSMVDALDAADPYQALLALARSSSSKAQSLSRDLHDELHDRNYQQVELPELLRGNFA